MKKNAVWPGHEPDGDGRGGNVTFTDRPADLTDRYSSALSTR